MNKDSLTNIIDDRDRVDDLLTGAPQQVQNATDQICKMLKIFIEELDINNKYSQKVEDSFSTKESYQDLCSGANQATWFGSRCVIDLLKIIIEIKDPEGKKKTSFDSTVENLDKRNELCSGAAQQVSIAAEAIYEIVFLLLDLIDESDDCKKQYDSDAEEIQRWVDMCSGAAQVTSVYTEYILKQAGQLLTMLDIEKKYSDQLNSIKELAATNNDLCSGAAQQSANYLYRTLEVMQLIGNCFLDKMQKLIDAYWAEHKDEKAGLETKIDELNKQISVICDEVEAVICPEIKEHQDSAKKLSKEMKTVMLEEIRNQNAIIDALKAEKSNMGAFKFLQRKEISAKIIAEEAALKDLIIQAENEKTEYNKKIKAENDKVKQLKEEVKKKKNEIRDKTIPIYDEIKEIQQKLDNPLT